MDASLLKKSLLREVIFKAVSSRGPGGQNVNKVSSAALLTWNVQWSTLITDEQRALICIRLSNLINKEGELLLRSDEFRDLPRNKERCLEKLVSLILKATHKPKKRHATKPSRSSQRKRLDTKTKHSHTKTQRRKVTSHED